MNQKEMENQYLVLDSRDQPLARGILESPQDAPTWQVEILDDKIGFVMHHEQLRFVPIADGRPALLGRILRSRGNKIAVEKLQRLDSELRQNLRMPVRFRTLIYPLSSRWKGRREAEANDLSCGGIAFFTGQPLVARERLEIVIPITTEPLLLRCEVIRQRASDREDAALYAARFVDMCHDEEMLVREAVFSVQISARRKTEDT